MSIVIGNYRTHPEQTPSIDYNSCQAYKVCVVGLQVQIIGSLSQIVSRRGHLMQLKKVFCLRLPSVTGILFVYNVSAQTKLECSLAAQSFWKSIRISVPGQLGNSTFEVLNANCTDVLTEGKA